MVVTDDKTIYLFRHKYFWVVDFYPEENKLNVSNSTAQNIADHWPKLPEDLAFGFTVGRSAFGNPIAGHTIFVKNGKTHDEDKYYRYHNREFKESGDLVYWNSGRKYWDDWRYIITVRNSSLVLLNTRAEFINPVAKGKTFVFDDSQYPGEYWSLLVFILTNP